MSQCCVGEAAGFWDSATVQGRLHQTSRCTRLLTRFVSLRSECLAQGKGHAKGCYDMDTEALKALALRNASVLMLGDSTSALLADHACGTFGNMPRSFIDVPLSLPNRSRYMHRLRSLDNHFCRLLGKGADAGLGLPLGTFSHYGVDGCVLSACVLCPLAACTRFSLSRLSVSLSGQALYMHSSQQHAPVSTRALP